MRQERQSLTKLILAGSLGLLVFFFSLVLLALLSPRLRPAHTDFVFAIHRRTFNFTKGTLLVLLAVVLFFFVRGLRRR